MPAFATLWSNHPNIKGDAPLLDKRVYENQCAINMSAACMRSGMKLSGYMGALSWEKDKPKMRNSRPRTCQLVRYALLTSSVQGSEVRRKRSL